MIYAKSTLEKTYIENEYKCLARICKSSIEIFGNGKNKFYYIIPNMKPTIEDWNLFKRVVQTYLNFKLDDKFIPYSFNLQIK